MFSFGTSMYLGRIDYHNHVYVPLFTMAHIRRLLLTIHTSMPTHTYTLKLRYSYYEGDRYLVMMKAVRELGTIPLPAVARSLQPSIGSLPTNFNTRPHYKQIRCYDSGVGMVRTVDVAGRTLIVEHECLRMEKGP